jgi:hypothetical protein
VNDASEAAPAREPQIPARLARNIEGLRRAITLAGKLEDRLLVISQPLSPDKGAVLEKPSPPSPPRNHLFDTLDAEADKIVALIRRLEDILNRLEV